MDTDMITREILLMTTTVFAQRQWCEKDRQYSNCNISPAAHLEEACRNGLLDELFPNIIETSHSHPLFLWQVRRCEFCIQIELCEYPSFTNNEFSIDPYLFIDTIVCS